MAAVSSSNNFNPRNQFHFVKLGQVGLEFTVGVNNPLLGRMALSEETFFIFPMTF